MSEQTATADEIALLHDLVAIPSINPGERAAVTYLCEQMARRGFLTNIDGIGNAIGSVGDGRFHVVLLGHIDTVPGHVPVRIKGEELLYGRGSVDAKGPLATFVAATARAYERGLLDGLRVTVIGGIGEEAHSPGANFLAETMPAPDACVIGEPGNWESVVLGYKGSMQLHYEIMQPLAHGAGQQLPAPQIAVGFWNGLAAFCAELNGEKTGAFERIEPTLRRFASDSDGLTERASMDINVRLPQGLAPEYVWAHLPTQNTAGTVTMLESPVPAYRCEKNTPLVRSLLAGVRAVGGTPRFKVKTGTADMNVVGPVWQCQMAAYGPGDSSLDHTPGEHISLWEYGRAIESLANALGELAAQARGRGA
jgi:[amino group carrier protein]-lysine/ornithine hydrolase